nr:uncharacterized protein LOC123766438 [Procambarus clarkii]
MDFFTAYFDEPLMEHIVHETNRLAADLIEGEELSEFSRLQRWKETTLLILRCLHFANNADERQNNRL